MRAGRCSVAVALGVALSLGSLAAPTAAAAALPKLSIASVSATEGNSGTTPVVFTVSATASSSSSMTVRYATSNGTAIAPGDYTATTGSVTIPARSTSARFTVLVLGDRLHERNETFTVTLSNPVNATVGTSTATGTITDDDAAPVVSVNAASATEGNTGTTPMVFTVRIPAASGLPATVTYAAADGTAKAPGDYTASSGAVTIPAGSLSATFSVPVVGDTLHEATETLTVRISAPVDATLGTSTATGTIVDNDAAPTVSVASASVAEGSSGTTAMTFVVSMPVASALPVSVHYATSNGTASAPADYLATTGTATIPAGSKSVTFPVLVVGDTLYEGNETFRVTISNPSGATLGTASATGTITDDDARPVVSVGGTSVHEGNSGTASAVVTVTSSAVSGLPITVSFATSNGTATAPGDYLATTGSVTIPAGSTSTTFIVLVVGDTLYEKNETFSVALSAPVNATLGTATATGTIVDDDPVPVVSISDTTRSEGNSGTAPMQFTVSLSAVSGLAVTATYTTANGSAHAPGDYTTASGTVTVPAGSTSATVGVPVVGDSLYEGNETFTTALSTPVNATLGIATATGTVLDDDAPPVVSLGDASVAEGNSGTTTMVFTVTTSVASGLTTTVNYQTSDGSATAPGDYTTAAGTVSIPAGSTSATFSVPVVGDTLYEGNETFSVALSGPVNATLGAAIATGTILDDDAALVLSVADVSVPEGNSGTKAMVFTVTASQAGGLPMSVGYTTSDGTASAPGDYLATTGTVTIPPGQTSATFTVLVVGDQLYEQDESFTLSLSGPVNATLDAATATGTIVDDDAPPAVSVGDASAVEGDSGTAAMVFTVSTDALSALPVTVAYTTSDGSATAPGDYTTAAGTVSIPAGSTSATFGVLVKGDTLHETNETFTVNLGNPVGAAIGAGSATGTIVDDDAAPTVSVADTSVPDGGNGTTTPAVFLVTLSAPSAGPVTVDYATSDGTATQPRNYTATSGTLTIAAGSTTATFTVPVIGGMPHEGDRTFTVTLADPSGATLADPATATGTIVDEHRLGIATGAVFWSETPAEQEAELADLESMGAQWIRTTLFWRAVQPDSPDAYDWSEPDSIVAAANAHHISIIFEVIGAPLWAVPGSQPGDIYDYPPDPSQYANFVAAVAARYNPQGVTAYELGNSPNLNNTGNTPNPAFYTSLLCATYSAVKAVAPQATVMTGGLGGTRDSNGNYSGAHFVQLLYADGAKGCFDAISFHPYTFPLLAPDDGTGGWSAMLTVRQTMVANGDADKKIWATEYGAPTNGPNSNSVSEAVQAQMLDTGYRLFAGYSWSGPMCWFQYQDKGTDASVQSNFFGLIRFDGSHKPAYSTFVADAAAAIP